MELGHCTALRTRSTGVCSSFISIHITRWITLNPIHTADADETKLFCRVASAWAVCT